MVKSLWFVSLLLCAGLTLRAQHKPAPSVLADDVAYSWGLKGGVSFSNINLTQNASYPYPIPPRTYHSRSGLYLGLAFHQPLARHWAVRPELFYSVQGFEVQFRDSVYYFKEDEPMGYIQLPLLVQYMARPGLTLYTGPQPGYLWYRQGDVLKRGDLAWVAGLGFISRFGLGIEARYNAGLLNVARDYEYTLYTKAKNRVVQVGLVYLFVRAKKRGRNSE